MESSDDNFAWITASSAYEDSDDESIENNMTENDKHTESESEKSYKRKLHKKLFNTEADVKHDLLNGDSVKHEPESDSPAPATPRKRKRKRERSPSAESTGHEYLEALVKQEQRSDEKTKKHKNRHNEHESQDVSQNSEPDPTEHIVKKKKSKRKKERPDESSEMIIEDKFSAEETVVETRPRQSSINMDIDENEGPKEEIVKKEKKKKKKRHVSEQVYQNDSSAQENNLDTRTYFQENNTNEDAMKNHNTDEVLNSSTKSKEVKQKATKISERIQFEDGEDVIAACNEATESFNQQSSKMRRFLRVNPHLHLMQCTSSSESLISQDDDIWLFNCPHEINVSSLKDKDISLDNKCKIKIDSHTFIGHVENEKNRAAIVTFEHNRPVIKSVELQGVVNFRKRIPKPHFLVDNVIANNQTNFIPLPDTKCRHPLFGPDYKKAMKIPSTIKSRLQNSDSENPITPKKGKKKKRKYVETDMGEDVADGVETGAEVVEQHTNRKHHHSKVDTDQPVKKKAKRIKQEVQSSETWDSEKAIEENLFNF